MIGCSPRRCAPSDFSLLPRPTAHTAVATGLRPTRLPLSLIYHSDQQIRSRKLQAFFIQLQNRLHQNAGAVRHIRSCSEFFRKMPDSTDAWNQDHSDRNAAVFVSSVDLTAGGHTVFNKFPRALAIIGKPKSPRRKESGYRKGRRGLTISRGIQIG